MIERMFVLGKELIFPGLSSIDVLYHAILQLHIGDYLVFTLLDQDVRFAKLSLSQGTFLWCCDLSLIIRKHLVRTFHILSERKEGVEISSKDYIVFLPHISKVDQGFSQLL
jgi:hypothetical protein